MAKDTNTILEEMLEVARDGKEVYPFMWQTIFGTNACVGAAVRKAKKLGLLVEGGKDGVGKPFYVLPAPVIPAPTHSAPKVMQ